MTNKSNICIDNWTDVKKKVYERAEAAQKAADNKVVTKDFVREQISEYEQKDKQQSDAVHKEINDKIANIIGSENDFYTKEESDSKYASVDTIPTKTSQLANDSSFITESEINLSEYAKIADVSTKFQLKGDYLTATDITGKANVDDVYTKDEADAKFLTQHQDISSKVEQSDFDTLKNNIWIGDLSTGLFKTIYKTQNSNSESVIWNDSTGGCFMFTDKDSSIRCFSGVNNGNDPNHVFVQMYAIDTTNSGRIGPRISLTKNGAFYSTDITRVSEEYEIVTKGSLSEYAKTTDIANAYQPKGTYLTEHQSLIDYAKITDVSNALGEYTKTTDIANAYQPKGTYLTEHQSLIDYAKITDVSNALEEKADAEETVAALETKANNSDLLIAKSEYDLLKAKVEYLEQLISEYIPGAQSEMINDGKIEDLSPDNKAVEITEPMQSVQLPETTTAYTINVPLKDDATVGFTSNKYAYINNTSEEPVNVTFTRDVPDTESENTANAIVYTTGQYDTITVENLSISQKDTDVNTINNVVITENNQKRVTLTVSLADGATITNNSECPITINNKTAVPEDAEPISSTIVAPNSTVTISGGQFNVVESTVGENTLIINKAVHIKKLIVSKGNVIVNDYTLDGHIDEIEYADATAASTYTVMPYTIDVTNKSDWSKASSNPGVYEVRNDIETTSRIAPGVFGSSARIKLNGHTVSCSDSNGAFLLRGTSHYIIENGTIDASAYGIWLSGPGIVELKDVTIIANTHALYIEKPNGQIFTSGNCYFKVTNDDKRYVANYFDSTYTNGWTTGFHFGEGTKFEDFDPMNSIGEPNGPVNILDPGFHTVKSTEIIDGESHDIYTVVKD